MVACPPADDPPARASLASRLLHSWRHALPIAANAAAGGGRRAAGAGGRALRQLVSLAVRGDPDPRALAGLGAAALVVGALGRVALSPLLGETVRHAAFAGVATAAWAVARYLVLAVLVTQPSVRRGTVAVAWGRSCLPYALALAGPLRAAAFAASAVIAYRSLVAAGVDGRGAAAPCAIAFGAEAAASAVAWIVVNGLVVLPFLG